MDGRPPFKPEKSEGQHPEYHHRVLSGMIPGYGPFINNKFILLEWCLDLELINI